MRSMGRKVFVHWGLATLATMVIGCGDDSGGESDGGGGSGDAGGAGGSGTGATGGGGAGTGAAAMGGGGAGAATCTDAITAAISANHGHALEIPLADIVAGVDKTYDASGSASHCHEVTLTAADFEALQSGGVVVKRSCNLIDHEYVLSCGTNPQAGTPDCSADPSEGAC